MWVRQFEEFVDRKIREATAASLPPYVTERDGHSDAMAALGNEWTCALFDGYFYRSPSPVKTVPACNLVFVQSKDGNTGTRNPQSLGGGETDKHLIYEGLSRVDADAVLTGASTAGDGNLILSVWHPELVRLRETLGKPRHPTQIVATLRGMDLEHGLLFNVPAIPVILLTVGPAMEMMQNRLAERPWVQTLLMSQPSDFRQAFERLSVEGIERVSCIGGRTLARQLLDARLVQDVYLTTSARAGGEPNTPVSDRPLDGIVVLRKHGTGPEHGVVFEHIAALA